MNSKQIHDQLVKSKRDCIADTGITPNHVLLSHYAFQKLLNDPIFRHPIIDMNPYRIHNLRIVFAEVIQPYCFFSNEEVK